MIYTQLFTTAKVICAISRLRQMVLTISLPIPQQVRLLLKLLPAIRA